MSDLRFQQASNSLNRHGLPCIQFDSSEKLLFALTILPRQRFPEQHRYTAYLNLRGSGSPPRCAAIERPRTTSVDELGEPIEARRVPDVLQILCDRLSHLRRQEITVEAAIPPAISTVLTAPCRNPLHRWRGERFVQLSSHQLWDCKPDVHQATPSLNKTFGQVPISMTFQLCFNLDIMVWNQGILGHLPFRHCASCLVSLFFFSYSSCVEHGPQPDFAGNVEPDRTHPQ